VVASACWEMVNTFKKTAPMQPIPENAKLGNKQSSKIYLYHTIKVEATLESLLDCLEGK
jgi:hypothetical protein